MPDSEAAIDRYAFAKPAYRFFISVFETPLRVNRTDKQLKRTAYRFDTSIIAHKSVPRESMTFRFSVEVA